MTRELEQPGRLPDQTAVDDHTDLIKACLPGDDKGRDWMYLGRLALGLYRSEPDSQGGPAVVHEATVRRWHELAHPGDGVYFDDTFMTFIRKWQKTDLDELGPAFRRARVAPDPPESAAYDSPGVRLLLRACIELQRAAGEDPFTISTSKAAYQLCGNASHWWAAVEPMKLLMARGHIEVVQRGDWGRPTARYRCLVGLPMVCGKGKR